MINIDWILYIHHDDEANYIFKFSSKVSYNI